MSLPPLVIQTAGSLAAILALAGLAWWLKLGGTPLLDTDDAVRRAAREVEDGFAPLTITRDYRGLAALARDEAGRIMMIKRHGNRFAGRVLGPTVQVRREGTALSVDCGEARFGVVTLDLPDSEAWEEAINRLERQGDA